jgi:hypothetical protein
MRRFAGGILHEKFSIQRVSGRNSSRCRKDPARSSDIGALLFHLPAVVHIRSRSGIAQNVSSRSRQVQVIAPRGTELRSRSVRAHRLRRIECASIKSCTRNASARMFARTKIRLLCRDRSSRFSVKSCRRPITRTPQRSR